MTQRSSGFSLIETMIAVSVLTIGIVGVLYMFPVGIKIQKSAQMSTTAIYLAQAEMERVISGSYDDQNMSVGTTTEDYGSISGFNLFKRVKRISYYDLANSTTTDDDSEMKKIEMSVFWASDEKNVKIATFISRR